MVLHCMMVIAGPFVLSGSVYLFFNKNRESYYMVVNTLNKKENYFHGVFPNSNTNEQKKYEKHKTQLFRKFPFEKHLHVSKGRLKAQRLGKNVE